MIYTENLSPDIAKVMLGEKYKEGCTYQLSQDKFEAAVLQWEPGEEEPTVIELKDEHPVGYDTFLWEPKHDQKRQKEFVYPEDILASMDRRYNAGKIFMIALSAIIAVTCIAFILGVYYGIFKV